MNYTPGSSHDLVLDHWRNYPPLSRGASVSIAIVLSVTMVIGAFGNTLVIVVYAKYRSLRTRANTFVINLTVADLLMCLLCLPILIASHIRGNMGTDFILFFCNFSAVVAALTGYVSIMSLTALSVDRCVAISRMVPAHIPVDNRWLLGQSLVFIWVTSTAFSVMPVLGFGRYVLEGSQLSCTFDYFTHTDLNIAFNVSIQIFFFVIPMITMSCCYVCIYMRVRIHEQTYFRKRRGKAFDEVVLRRFRRRRKFEKIELKTARAAVLVIVVFLVSWLPYSVISWLCLLGDSSRVSPTMVAFPAIFAKISTVLNPILYTCRNASFQRKLQVLFRNLCFKEPESAQFSVQSHSNILVTKL